MISLGCTVTARKRRFSGPAKVDDSAGLAGIRATAIVSIYDGEKKVKGRAVVIASEPDFFRIEILGPFNSVVYKLAYNGIYLSILNLRENKLHMWSGNHSPYPVETALFSYYLRGMAPPGIVMDKKGRRIAVSRNRDGSVSKIVEERGGIGRTTISMVKYKTSSGRLFPYTILFKAPPWSMTLHYRSVQFNPDTTEDFFEIKMGEKTKVIYHR